MALTKKDVEVIEEIFRTLLADQQKTNNTINQVQTSNFEKFIETNVSLLNEIKKVAENTERVLERTDNIVKSLTDGLSSKINSLYIDVCSKDGYLTKISTKLSYFWIPLLGTLVSLTFLIFKMYSGK